MKTYYEKNRVAAKRYQKEYYWKNRELILEKQRKKKEEDPDQTSKSRAYQSAYYEKNRGQILAKRASKRKARTEARKRRANAPDDAQNIGNAQIDAHNANEGTRVAE